MVTLKLRFHREEQLGKKSKKFPWWAIGERIGRRVAGMRTSQVSHWQAYPAVTQAKPAGCLTSSFSSQLTPDHQEVLCIQNRSVIRLPHGIQPPSFHDWIIATASTLPHFACPAPPHSHRGSLTKEASSHLSLVLTKHSVALCLPKSLITSSPFLSCSNPQVSFLSL